MVTSCCAYGCTFRYKKGSAVGIYRFPKDEFRRQDWIIALKRKNWKPTANSRVCGKHFQTGKPSLYKNHPDYVPNVFSFTPKQNTVLLYEKGSKNHEKEGVYQDKQDSVSLLLNTGPVQGESERGKILKERRRLRPTAVPSCYLPVTLSENLKEDELEKSVKGANQNVDTYSSSLQSELHEKQSNTPNTRNWDHLIGSNMLTDVISEDSEDLCVKSDDESEVNDNPAIINELQMFKETRGNENTSDSEEDMNENLIETIFDSGNSPCSTDNADEFLKRKLEVITEQYEKAWKKMKLYQRKCKLYAKQATALKEVIDSLKQINSVPNDT